MEGSTIKCEKMHIKKCKYFHNLGSIKEQTYLNFFDCEGGDMPVINLPEI
jgi:hypothetical protein